MKASFRYINNFRGLSLFKEICKVYDHAIIFLCYKKNFWYAIWFEANHSTVICGLVYHEIINHYLKICIRVYSSLLDASKAFDKVYDGKLFKI